MSGKHYPRIGTCRDMRQKWDAQRKQHPKDKSRLRPCRACGEPGTHSVFVQVSWFRGEDEGPFNACLAHRNDATGLLLGQVAVGAAS